MNKEIINNNDYNDYNDDYNKQQIINILKLNDLQNDINNIDNINIIGDIHGDIIVLLKFLENLNLIHYEIEYYTINSFNKLNNNLNNNKIYYHFKYDDNNNNSTYNLYYHTQFNTDILTSIDKINVEFPLIINYNSYFDLNNNDDILPNFCSNRNIIKIYFNFDIINSLKNNVIVILGDIIDTHYYNNVNKNKLNNNRFIIDNSPYKLFIYNNDIGCYHILFILKYFYEFNINNNNRLILLYGNHEYNATIDDDNYIYDKNKYINDEKFRNVIDAYIYYLISPIELKEILNNKVNIYVYYNQKREMRKNYLLNNINNFNFIISINKKILISHNLIYQKILNNLIKSLKLNNINDFVLIQILESIFKYLLNTKRFHPNFINNNNDIYNKFTLLINDRLNNNNLGINCSLNNDFNSCNNIIHIIGHIPQYNINYNLYNNYDNINIQLKNYDKYKASFYNIDDNKLYEYNNYFIYFNDLHLSLSFDDNFDINKYYFLNIKNINNNYVRKYIKFMDNDYMVFNNNIK